MFVVEKSVLCAIYYCVRLLLLLLVSANRLIPSRRPTQTDKEVALRTLAAQNTHRKRKLGDLKDMIGEVSSSPCCRLETVALRNGSPDLCCVECLQGGVQLGLQELGKKPRASELGESRSAPVLPSG